MAGILAHEIKNPLAGIRGAAQLIEPNVGREDGLLIKLICDETDRVCALVDRLEVFSDGRPIRPEPVNIHRVLEHVRSIAQNSFARDIRFVEEYDPSLPAVFGVRDQLVQVFLNLIKNAADATPEINGEIVLSTGYRRGARLALQEAGDRLDLPLEVSVRDNGPGIRDDIRDHLFDPFVSTKADGQGLGLALVAKIIGDHGGVIEFESRSRGTIFTTLLPIYMGVEND
jgi:two-component system nitrogen regulation sensor histidine kinase GlnL